MDGIRAIAVALAHELAALLGVQPRDFYGQTNWGNEIVGITGTHGQVLVDVKLAEPQTVSIRCEEYTVPAIGGLFLVEWGSGGARFAVIRPPGTYTFWALQVRVTGVGPGLGLAWNARAGVSGCGAVPNI